MSILLYFLERYCLVKTKYVNRNVGSNGRRKKRQILEIDHMPLSL